MRLVWQEEDLKDAWDSAKQESKAAFANDDMYMEKFIEDPRHIEIQIAGDQYGRVCHLSERDCSIQRRHQKLVEEGPWLTDEVRSEIGALVCRGAEQVGYKGLATFEFLRDTHGEFYFLEVNPRVQVEHTVTEMITGHNLVELGIRVAQGDELSLQQSDISWSGHAIQCRINAEDPQNGFRPSSGKITAYLSPGGVGVRIDGVVYKDYTVPPYYDALLAKMTVQGRTWDETVRRTHRSLEEFVLRGVKTTIPFMMRIMEEPDFKAGRFDTSYLEAHPELFDYEQALEPEDMIVALSAAIAAYEGL